MSHKKIITEILSTHADQILQKEDTNKTYANLLPENPELPSLLNLADHVKEALTPVQPVQSFKEKLQQELLLEARRKQEEREKSNLIFQKELPLLISAAVSALIALSSLLLFLKWQHKPKQQF